MNEIHLQALLRHFNLGTSKKEPQRVHGGLLHTMWRIENENKIYAVKQLSPDINLTDKKIIRNYNLTEEIADLFIQQNIPAVGAMEVSGQYLYYIDDTGYLVYPWINGKANNTVSEWHCLKIAEILSKMHRIDLQIPEISKPVFDVHSDDKITQLVIKAIDFSCPFSLILNEMLPDLLRINKAYKNAIPILEKQVVVSHGDLDQKNVLWDGENPIMIDWECARKLNPTYEIINASLDWAGISTNFNETLFEKMIDAYKHSGGNFDKASLEASFYGVLGNWINWMVYNIERSCNDENYEQKAIGIEQVTAVLLTIQQINNLISEFD